MTHVVRPLTRWRHCCSTNAELFQLLNLHSLLLLSTTKLPFFPSVFHCKHLCSGALKQSGFPSSFGFNDYESNSNSSDKVKKSCNEKKHEARRAVYWGMELSNFLSSSNQMHSQAMKDGDQSKFRELCSSGTVAIGEDDKQKEEEIVSENDEEDSEYNVDIATRWFEGLVNKDMVITNEIYSLREVEFDRQELRKLLRIVHSTQEQELEGSVQFGGKW